MTATTTMTPTTTIRTLTNELTFNTIEPGSGLRAALARPPADALRKVESSGLRGRGGAGFPTSLKWELAAKSPGEKKYVICNADEGEPGTFKDRVILAEFADLVFEGMTIGALVIGAKQGIVYLRAEYTYLRPHLEAVLQRRRDAGLLGPAVELGAGSYEQRAMSSEQRAMSNDREAQSSKLIAHSSAPFAFDIAIRMGSGAYVCGEETALIESLEGQRGEPRNRPPFPIDTGFMGNPTIVNNVETFAWVTCVLSKGPEWFRSIGTEKSTGRKLFSVSGDCAKPGVYELAMGITVAQLLKEVGGEGAKAVQIGGAAGQCVPAAHFDRTIAYEDIATGGSVIVLGPNRDLLRVVKNFLEFFLEESCGQCTPCREGIPKLLEGVELLQQGRCSMDSLKELCDLGETMQLASKCGLGQSAPIALRSVVEHFQDEILGRVGSKRGAPAERRAAAHPRPVSGYPGHERSH